MKTVALGDVVDFYSGATPSKAKPELWNGEIPWFSAKDMKKSRLTQSADHVSDGTSLRRLPAGTVAIVVRGMILAHTVPISVLEVDATINQDLKALLPRREIDPTFLAAMLKAQHASILAQVTTAAHGTKKLDSRVLEHLRIPLPPITEQRRVAAILDQADALRAKRRQILARLEALTQAIFRDMFGALKNHHWTSVKLGEIVGQIENGTSPVCAARPAKSGEVGVLKLGAVTYGVFRPEENKAFLGHVGSMAANEVRAGDVLMTRKNTRDLVGAVALVDDVREGLLLPDLIFRLQLDQSRVDRYYFHALMMHPIKRQSVRDLSSGSAASMPNISKARLKHLPIELPPLGLQRRFAAKLEHVATQRLAQQRAASVDAELFASLQARAFRGEL